MVYLVSYHVTGTRSSCYIESSFTFMYVLTFGTCVQVTVGNFHNVPLIAQLSTSPCLVC